MLVWNILRFYGWGFPILVRFFFFYLYLCVLLMSFMLAHVFIIAGAFFILRTIESQGILCKAGIVLMKRLSVSFGKLLVLLHFCRIICKFWCHPITHPRICFTSFCSLLAKSQPGVPVGFHRSLGWQGCGQGSAVIAWSTMGICGSFQTWSQVPMQCPYTYMFPSRGS